MNEVDELKERIEELKNEVEELEQSLEESEQHDDRFDDGYDKAMLEMENKIERAFYAGYKSGKDAGLAHYTGNSCESNLKSLLNYNMEQRL